MGGSSYSTTSRSTRAFTSGYTTLTAATMDSVFTQNTKREIHDEMSPKNVAFRESRDSDVHPNTIPIQFYLDVTGSMGSIPLEMIKNGLPKLMSALIQNGVPDAAILFGAVGDHECDQCPLQIGQFESGDEELDMWLTRTYIEGGGGGNAGESYLLAWYFAANHVKTDAFDKRGKKGFVFTIGDEPCLKNLPHSAIKEIMGDTTAAQSGLLIAKLLEMAQEKNHVYHIHVNHGRKCDPAWKELLGDNLIEISDHTTVAKVISDIILETLKNASDVVETAKHENLL